MKKVCEKERQSFTFYLSFYKAIKGLKSRERLMIYDAIAEFALLGKEPDELSAISQLVWDLVEPTLSKSRASFINGCKTPHPKKTATSEPSENTHSLPSEQVSQQGSEHASETVSTDTDRDTETNRDTKTDTNRETETDKETKGDTIGVAQRHERQAKDSSTSRSSKVLAEEYLKKIRSDTMRRAVGEWFEYKRERGEAYRTMKGMQVFCLKLKELSDGNEYRAQQIISNSMANNWSGIFPLKDDYVPKAQRGEGYLRGYS